jgi:capsular polysaccharide transport system permease protein
LENLQRSSLIPVKQRNVRIALDRLKRVNRLFVWTVVIPTIASITYYGLIASDVYVSESRYVVRSPEKEAQTGIVGALLQGNGFTRSQDDTYAVNDYVTSRDALAVINKDNFFVNAYSNKSIDFISRFPGFDFDRSFEGLLRYYQNQTDVTLDSTSSITSLKVNAFNPEDAHRINELLLEQGEKLVNRMNDRARQDMVRDSTVEVARAEARVKDAAVAVSAYRRDQGIFDPEKESAMKLQQVAGIQDSLITSRTQLAQLKALSPDNPQIAVLKGRIETLQSELAKSAGTVVGNNGSFANKAPGYERLMLEREFAEKQLASAMASLETSRTQAQRQQLYLERISQPSFPDKALLPKRMRGVLTVLLLGLIVWGATSLLVSAVKEHRD